MANNREIIFRADGRRNPAFLYRDAAETVRMFSLSISLNNAYRKLHRAYDNFTVKPEDMKKLKEEFSGVVNSLASHIQKVEATLSKPKEKGAEKKVEQKKETPKKEEQLEKKKEPKKEKEWKPILKKKAKTTKEK